MATLTNVPKTRASSPRLIANNIRETARTAAWMVENFGPNMPSERRGDIESAAKRAIRALCDLCEVFGRE